MRNIASSIGLNFAIDHTQAEFKPDPRVESPENLVFVKVDKNSNPNLDDLLKMKRDQKR